LLEYQRFWKLFKKFSRIYSDNSSDNNISGIPEQLIIYIEKYKTNSYIL